MNDLVIQNREWDDPVGNEAHAWWAGWIDGLQQLPTFEFPRCLLPFGLEDTRVELHVFCDASEDAFAAVAYLRSCDVYGNVSVRLACSKTKVSSKRPKTIPKLELHGAVLAARLANNLRRVFRFRIEATFFWTDSLVVRAWITNVAQQFKPFVAVRVGEIQTLTRSREWRHVPGTMNPADMATRASQIVLLNGLWISGPSFLMLERDHWPGDIQVEPTVEEVRAKFLNAHSVRELTVGAKEKDLERALETWIREEPGGTLEGMIVAAQSEMFPEEVQSLHGGSLVPKSSRLLELSPFLDSNGVLRSRGKLSHAQLGYDQRYPVILCPKHPLTKLIIRDSHHRHHHPGVNHGLGILRQEYWILRGREAVKRARRECEHCQKMTARSATQEMADLPKERLASGRPPFYFTSVDLFGPIEALVLRNKIEKRWGSIFACMTTRAVHIEVAPSLSSQDFLNIMRNFINLRGKPHQIYSDNGTNFVGAHNLLVELARKGGQGVLSLEVNNIHWKFQPPGAPHWGGVH
ncbi:uncharacterized protein LOC131876953 [Tigriopus californicus]|uniref:uncharacterized protein LOC131876953 n=1 Tax=Tigriopus californicus TaxID=6832 RepID=UPI0027DA52B8|nr:uncharacterized protein LOC131876953 [Tigriopus californicus]